jgi:hypothetical protein
MHFAIVNVHKYKNYAIYHLLYFFLTCNSCLQLTLFISSQIKETNEESHHCGGIATIDWGCVYDAQKVLCTKIICIPM